MGDPRVRLKAVVNSSAKTHDIGQLASELEALVQARNGQPLPVWVKTWLREIADSDPTATAYRYGERYDRATKAHLPVEGEGEEHVELRNPQTAMETMHAGLSRLHDENQSGEWPQGLVAGTGRWQAV